MCGQFLSGMSWWKRSLRAASWCPANDLEGHEVGMLVRLMQKLLTQRRATEDVVERAGRREGREVWKCGEGKIDSRSHWGPIMLIE